MVIQIDTREKTDVVRGIVDYFDANGIKHIRSKLPFGDYCDMDNPAVYIDRKHNLAEVVQNVCQGHARFVRELELCNSCGKKMIVLVEHGGKIKTLKDVQGWVNPRIKTSPLAMSGERLYKVLLTMQEKYDVRFLFCQRKDTGAEIVRLLQGE